MHAVLKGDSFSLLSVTDKVKSKSLLTSKWLRNLQNTVYFQTVVHNLCLCLVVSRGSDKYLDTLTAPVINMQTLKFKT